MLLAEDEELRRMEATLGWRALQAYRRIVASSGFLSSVHGLLARLANRFIPRRRLALARGQELRRVQATLGWRMLETYRRFLGASRLLSVVHSVLAWPARRLLARPGSQASPTQGPCTPNPAGSTHRVMSASETPWSGAGVPESRSRNPAHRFLKYPLYLPAPVLDRWERLLVKLRLGVAKCTVCGWVAPLFIEHENLRETALCGRCGARTRQRQIAYVACHALSAERNRKIRSMKELAQLDSLVVYNTETTGAVHRLLSRRPDYLCSEYLGPGLTSGTMVDNIMHQDLMQLSFASDSIDLVLSSDVFEHVADPYRAHAEILRVLKPGGRHVFTVPFYQTEFLDEVRATLDERGNVVFLKEAVYHQDPVRMEEGVLVYTLFSVEMLVKLRRLGFRTNMYHLHSRFHGMLGPNGLVFEAVKE